jgi:acetate kinase
VRAEICAGLGWLGARIDPEANTAAVGGREGRIDAGGSRLELWVIPTDEELLIARDAYRVVAGIQSRY